MKTTITLAASLASLLALATVGCAADAPEPEEPVGAAPDTSESTTAKMISQGSCSPQQLAMGAYEVDGYCYSGDAQPPVPSRACVDRCSRASARCESICDQRGGSQICYSNCVRAEYNCMQACP